MSYWSHGFLSGPLQAMCTPLLSVSVDLICLSPCMPQLACGPFSTVTCLYLCLSKLHGEGLEMYAENVFITGWHGLGTHGSCPLPLLSYLMPEEPQPPITEYSEGRKVIACQSILSLCPHCHLDSGRTSHHSPHGFGLGLAP